MITAPAFAFVGSETNFTFAAAAGFIVNAGLTAEVSVGLENVRFLEPERLMLRLLNVAIPVPPTVGCVSVPLKHACPRCERGSNLCAGGRDGITERVLHLRRDRR